MYDAQFLNYDYYLHHYMPLVFRKVGAKGRMGRNGHIFEECAKPKSIII